MTEEELLLKIKTELDSSGLDAVEQKAGGIGAKLGALAGPAAAGVAAIGVAAVGAGAALFKVGDEFGSAIDTLRTATGKTGDDLEALGDSMKNVMAGVPNSMSEVSSVMAELSSRTGLTGEDLEKLTTQTLQLARVTGGDAQASVESLTRMLGDASVPAEEHAAALDMVYRASQTTGVGVDRLSQLMVQFGAPMRNLGMSMEESTALLGRFEKEGVNTELVMGALKAASAKWAKEGVAPAEGLKQTIAKIQELGPSAEATALAMETFGQKAGGDMVDTILGGKFAIDDLVSSIAGSSETIAKANEDTTGFAEKWEQTKNQLLVAIEPIATGFLEMVEGVGGAVLDKLLPVVENLGYAFSDLMDGDFVAVFNDLGFSMETATKFGEPLTALWESLGYAFSDLMDGDFVAFFNDLGVSMEESNGIVDTLSTAFDSIKTALSSIDWAGIGSTIATLAGYFMDGLGVVLPIIASIFKDVLWPAIQPVFTFVMDHIGVIAGLAAAFFMLTNPIGLVVAAIMGIGALGPTIGKFFDDLGAWLSNLGVTIGTALAGAAGWFAGIPAALLSVLGGLGASAGGAVMSGLSAIGDFFKAGWAAFLVLVQAGQDAITDWLMSIWEAIPADIRADLELIAAAIVEKFQAYYDNITAKMSEIATAISDAWTAIKDTITERIEAARVMISAKWDAIKEYLDAKLQQISAAIAVIWQGIKDKIADVMQGIRDKINEVWDWINEKIHNALNSIQDIFNNVMDWISEKTGVSMDKIKGYFDDAMTVIHDIVDVFISFFKGDWEGMFDAIQRVADNAWTAIKNIFSDAWEGLKRIINWDELKAKFEAGKAALMAAGKMVVEGLKQGISEAWESLKAWFGEKIRGLLGDIKGLLGIKSPSSVFAEEVGEPIGEGIIQGLRRSLEAAPLAGLVAGWAEKDRGFIPKLLTPILVSAMATSMAAAMQKAQSSGLDSAWFGGAGMVGGAVAKGGVDIKVVAAAASAALQLMAGSGIDKLDSMWFGGTSMANPRDRAYSQHYGPTEGPGSGGAGGVKADAFRSGKGGHLAASKSNYWQVFVSKWGIPTEESARKVARQLGIPLPQWLEDIYNPKGSESYVDPMAPMKEALEPAEEAARQIAAMAAAASGAAAELEKWTGSIAVEADLLRGTIISLVGDFDLLDVVSETLVAQAGSLSGAIGGLLPPLDALIPILEPITRGAPPGGSPGGPIIIEPPPGGSVNVERIDLGNIVTGPTHVYLDSREIARGVAKSFVEDVTILDQLGKALGKRKAQTS